MQPKINRSLFITLRFEAIEEMMFFAKNFYDIIDINKLTSDRDINKSISAMRTFFWQWNNLKHLVVSIFGR
ncbi:hypothetical protein CYR52_08275 [Chimaeribacter arupi]|nr:hypothetical protein CYR52_08275 [Chimaeribacter arupi]